MSDNRPEPFDRELCTCTWSYTGGREGPMEGIRRNVDPRPAIIQLDPNCPERARPDHWLGVP